MTISRFIIPAALVVACIATSACRKKVDPAAFDAGATADTAAVPEVDAAVAEVADAAAPLASLAPPKVTPVPHHSAAPKPQPPECAKAAQFCNHPAIGKDKAIQALCDKNKADCTSKGGHFP